MCDQQRLRPACAYAQTDQSLCLSLEYSMTVELLTEHCLEFLSLTGGCTGSSESTLVKMSNCWKSRAAAHFIFICLLIHLQDEMCFGTCFSAMAILLQTAESGNRYFIDSRQIT